MARLNDVSAIPLGFPYEMLASEAARKRQLDPKLASIVPPRAFK